MRAFLSRVAGILAVLFLVAPLSRAADIDPASAGAVPCVPEIASQNYRLAFSDEFNGTAVDEAKWFYRVDRKEKSTQLPANVTESGGLLHLAAKKESVGGKAYTAGGVISREQFEYGYYEARFRVPPGVGWHTSFWTMPYNGKDTICKTSQEIDICEDDSHPDRGVYSSGIFAWGTPALAKHESIARKIYRSPKPYTDFHVWSAEFTPKIVNFYYDGKLTHSYDATKFVNGPQNIWLSTLGLTRPIGTPVDDTRLPAEADFDYVRYFRKE